MCTVIYLKAAHLAAHLFISFTFTISNKILGAASSLYCISLPLYQSLYAPVALHGSVCVHCTCICTYLFFCHNTATLICAPAPGVDLLFV